MSRNFNYIAAINIAEISAFLEGLSFDEEAEEEFRERRIQFSKLLVDWFKLCPPNIDNEPEILASVLANILLGNSNDASEVIRKRRHWFSLIHASKSFWEMVRSEFEVEVVPPKLALFQEFQLQLLELCGL